MKRISTLLFLLIVLQSYSQDSFLKYTEIFEEAHQESKPILMIFSGSDWCKPCIKLKKEILLTPSFNNVSKDFIYLYLDFPYKKKNRLSKEKTKRNEQLAERYNPSGQFPFVVVVESSGEELGIISLEMNMKTETFIEQLQKTLPGYEK
jgi:thioredoxin-related protein